MVKIFEIMSERRTLFLTSENAYDKKIIVSNIDRKGNHWFLDLHICNTIEIHISIKCHVIY